MGLGLRLGLEAQVRILGAVERAALEATPPHLTRVSIVRVRVKVEVEVGVRIGVRVRRVSGLRLGLGQG